MGQYDFAIEVNGQREVIYSPTDKQIEFHLCPQANVCYIGSVAPASHSPFAWKRINGRWRLRGSATPSSG